MRFPVERCLESQETDKRKTEKIPHHLTNFANQSFYGVFLLSFCRQSLREITAHTHNHHNVFIYTIFFFIFWHIRKNMQENEQNDNSSVFILVRCCCYCCCVYPWLSLYLVILCHCSSCVIFVVIVLIWWHFYLKWSYQNIRKPKS